MKLPNINIRDNKAFTLVELLVVIGIIGILAAGLLVAINPLERIRSADDVKAQNAAAGLVRALENYAADGRGYYPATWADAQTELSTSGFAKSVPANFGTNYTITYSATGASCAVATRQNCTGFVLIIPQLSDRSRNAASSADADSYYKYDSATSKGCVVDETTTATTGCQ